MTAMIMTTTTMDTTTHITTKPRILFFGTPEFVLPVLEALQSAGLTPDLIISAPDKPFGRKQLITPPPVAVWAKEHGVALEQPVSLKGYIPEGQWDLFIVAGYGKIIPQRILDIPRRGTLNVHPSLLPKFRGASPVQGAILAGEVHSGVSLMQLDAEMDHGPILAVVPYDMKPNETTSSAYKTLFAMGGAALAEIIPAWLEGSITPREQVHSEATYTKRFTTEDGLLDFKTMSGEEIDRRVRALNPEPGTYAFFEVKGSPLRVKILESEMQNGELKIKSVQPEGKTPMTWERFSKILENR